MSTTVIYNGVTISNCLTERFEQELVYESTGTDPLYNKFTIQVTGYVTANGLSSEPTFNISTNTNSNSPSNQIRARQRLMEPRKDFVMKVGSGETFHTLLEAQAAKPDSQHGNRNDTNSGPKPHRCNITMIAGTELMKVSWIIEICLLDCYDAKNTLGVLNNRFSMGDEYDEDWYCTRTIRGQLQLLTSNLDPQSFRSWVFPTLQNGYQRASISVNTSLDGKCLDYVISDKQRYAAPPSPATTWEATHSLSTTGGAVTHGELSIVLKGAPNTPKLDLLATCAAIAEAKLRIGNVKTILESAEIIDYMHANEVHFRARVLMSEGGEQDEAYLKSLAVENRRLCQFLTTEDISDYDPKKWPVPKTFPANSPVGLLVCALQSPCDNNHRIFEGQARPSSPSSETVNREETEVTTSEGNLSTEGTTHVSQEHKENLYSYYRIDARYIHDENLLQLPIAKASGSAGDTSKFIQLAGEVVRKQIKIAAERFGEWPKIPKAVKTKTESGVTLRLLRHEVTPKAPEFTANGQSKLFSIDATYIYGLSKPPAEGQPMVVGSLPWDTSTLAQNEVPTSATGSGIV